MVRSRRSSIRASLRGRARDRHGRGIRAAVTGPHLPPLRIRSEIFDMTIAQTAEYLREIWPDELAGVTFEVAGMPAELGTSPGVDRWRVFPREHRVVLYRLPIERLSHLHRHDELHRRMMIETCVFRAVAELLGKDPWELAPDRYRNH
jgi:hypothetical protein